MPSEWATLTRGKYTITNDKILIRGENTNWMRKHYKKEKILARLENTTEWENTILRGEF